VTSAVTAILRDERRDEKAPRALLPTKVEHQRKYKMRGGILIVFSAIQGVVGHLTRKIREIFLGKPYVIIVLRNENYTI